MNEPPGQEDITKHDTTEPSDSSTKEVHMIDIIGKACMLEQLAEECMELGHAALKAARAIRGINPIRGDINTADKRIREEYTDVVQVAQELGLKVDYGQMSMKHIR